MNFLFITGSLFAGHDGVADYTLRLAQALRRRGHSVRTLSWHEVSLRHPKIATESLCIPGHLPVRAKLAQAQHFLGQWQPDVVSLQFVPYAFDAKGLPQGLAQQLSGLIQNKPLHLFAHELWVMPCMRSSWLSRAVGLAWQKPLILNTFRQLRPRAIHTSLPLYRQELLQAGLPVGPLWPIPGNIPLIPLTQPPLPPSPQRSTRHVGFFGNIFPSTPLERFAQDLLSLQKATGLILTLTSAGNLPSPAIRRWNHLARRLRGQLAIERLGHLAAREASYFLQSIDFLASGYSPSFFSKSGSIAAARELGKPVILLSPPELPGPVALPQGLFTELTPQLLSSSPLFASQNFLDPLADQFLQAATCLVP